MGIGEDYGVWLGYADQRAVNQPRLFTIRDNYGVLPVPILAPHEMDKALRDIGAELAQYYQLTPAEAKDRLLSVFPVRSRREIDDGAHPS